MGTKGIQVWFVKGCTWCVLLVFDLNRTHEPFTLSLGSMAFLCSGDCRRQPMFSSRWSLKVLPVRVKSSVPTFSHWQGERTWPVECWACWGRRSYPEEEMGLLKAQSRPWLPAAPLPSRLCSPDGNLGEMRSTAVPKCTMLVPTFFFFWRKSSTDNALQPNRIPYKNHQR